jgi:hypothetical protein
VPSGRGGSSPLLRTMVVVAQLVEHSVVVRVVVGSNPIDHPKKMKKIGRGWQYVVFDLGNGRVRKEKYSKIKQFLLISKELMSEGKIFVFLEALKERRRVDCDEQSAIKYLKEIEGIMDWKILGNPIFIDGGYEQDKVITLDEVFKTVSVDEGKEIFNKYLELIYETWKYGFSDKIFNFSINNGINSEGEVIQLDFGELSFDKEEMRKRIKERCWLKRYSYWEFPEGELKEYYASMMNPEKLIIKLDELWGSKLQNWL